MSLRLALVCTLALAGCVEPEYPGTSDSGGDTSWCETGSVCGTVCADRTKDPLNCGACNRKCAAGESCNDGLCKACKAPSVDCTGTCIDTTSDPKNCGGCRLPCPGTQKCIESACSCDKLAVCGIDCVDLQIDDKNCGKCGAACSGSQTCFGGVCK